MLLEFLVISGICVTSTCSNTDTPDCVQFTATVRSMFHGAMDFESLQCCGSITGLLDNYIDSERPRFVPSRLRNQNSYSLFEGSTYMGASIANNGEFFFDQWYMDVPRLNIPFPVTINLTLQKDGTYIFDSNYYGGFFPVDAKGYKELYIGSVGHKFSFTTHVQYPFFYNGSDPHKLFSFSGDDDLWVFLNKKLVKACDIGGVHSALGCSFYLDDPILGLIPNKTYTLDVYNAERHTTQSNFKVTTTIIPRNIPPTSTNISVTFQGYTPAIPQQISLPATDANGDSLTARVYPPYPKSGYITTGSTVINSNSTAPFYVLAGMQFFYTPNSLYVGNTAYDVINYSLQDNCAEIFMWSVSITVVGATQQVVFLPPLLQNTINVTMTRGDVTQLNLTAIDQNSPALPLSYLDDVAYDALWAGCINVLGLDQTNGLLTVQGLEGTCTYTYQVSNKRSIGEPPRGTVIFTILQPPPPPAIEETVVIPPSPLQTYAPPPYQPPPPVEGTQPPPAVVVVTVTNANAIPRNLY